MTDMPVKPRVLVGDVDISSSIRRLNSKAAISQLSTADLIADPEILDIPNLNWRFDINIEVEKDGRFHQIFRGKVFSVQHSSSSVQIRCVTGIQMLEYSARPVLYKDCGMDLMYAVVRGAGVADEDISIEGFPANDPELIDVTIGIGLSGLSEPITVGEVTLMPPGGIQGFLHTLEQSEIVKAFRSYPAFAHVAVGPFAKLLEAEDSAVRKVDTVAAYLRTRGYYSYANLPDGAQYNWDRSLTFARFQRGNLALVRGRVSSRLWLRDFTNHTLTRPYAFQDPSLKLETPGLVSNLPDASIEFLISAARSIDSADDITRILAISDAIEFYAGHAKPPAKFSSEEIDAIKSSIPDTLNADQRARVDQMISSLNNPPLMAKFSHQLELDGLKLSAGEMAALQKVRRARNKAAHGRVSRTTLPDEIDAAASIIVRILMHHLALRSTGES